MKKLNNKTIKEIKRLKRIGVIDAEAARRLDISADAVRRYSKESNTYKNRSVEQVKRRKYVEELLRNDLALTNAEIRKLCEGKFKTSKNTVARDRAWFMALNEAEDLKSTVLEKKECPEQRQCACDSERNWKKVAEHWKDIYEKITKEKNNCISLIDKYMLISGENLYRRIEFIIELRERELKQSDRITKENKELKQIIEDADEEIDKYFCGTLGASLKDKIKITLESKNKEIITEIKEENIVNQSLLPLILVDDENKIIEFIICSLISGKNDYTNNMPEMLELIRTCDEGIFREIYMSWTSIEKISKDKNEELKQKDKKISELNAKHMKECHEQYDTFVKFRDEEGNKILNLEDKLKEKDKRIHVLACELSKKNDEINKIKKEAVNTITDLVMINTQADCVISLLKRKLDSTKEKLDNTTDLINLLRKCNCKTKIER